MRRESRHASPDRIVSRRKKYSQNFLIDQSAIAQFIKQMPESGGVPAIEVGAGDGVLTRAISPLFPRITAYEIDDEMVARITRSGVPENVEVLQMDFLMSRPPTTPFHLVGNVPFGITSEVVRWALNADSAMTATLITEWAYARKRSGDYGRWTRVTVESWPWMHWSIGGRISRRAFRPVPSVDAGILKLNRRRHSEVSRSERRSWEKFVELGFTGLGGSLYRSLSTQFNTAVLRTAFRELDISEDTVVAFIHPDDWLTLFDRICRSMPRLA